MDQTRSPGGSSAPHLHLMTTQRSHNIENSIVTTQNGLDSAENSQILTIQNGQRTLLPNAGGSYTDFCREVPQPLNYQECVEKYLELSLVFRNISC